MRFRLAAPLALSVAAVFAFAYSGPPSALAAQGGGRGGGEETALGRYMGDLNQTLKKLKGPLGDPKTMGDALDEVCRLQKLVIDAKNEVPSTVSSIEDEKKRDKARGEFRMGLQGVERTLLDIEAAILQQDAKAAGKALRELEKEKDAGHSQFKPKD